MKRLFLIVAFVCLALPANAQILLKQSTATTVNGKLTKIADGTDHTGLTVTSITAKFIKQSDTTSSAVTAVTCAASGSANDCVEVAAGVYNMELSAGNTDTLGRLDVCMLASGDYTDCVRYEVVPSGYYDLAVTTGPTTAPTNFSTFSIDASGRIDLGKILGTAVSTPATAGILDVNIKNIDNDAASASGTVTFPNATLARETSLAIGTAQAGGGASQIILAAAENFAVNDHPVGALVTILSGTGKGQSRVITAYTNSTDTATLDTAWVTNPDATSIYAVIPFPVLQSAATVATAVWASGTRTLTNLGTGVITTATFAAGAIDAAAIGADAIGASELAANAIGASELAAGAITSATFAAGAIDATAIATDAIGAAELATNAITSNEIADGAIDAGALATDTITAVKIAADAITSAKIANDAIGATEIAAAAIDRATYAADTGHVSLRSGTAAAGAAGTITLDSGASAVNDFYNNATIVITGGNGAGQTRAISDYDGGTKVATVNNNWATNPDNTSTFALLPMGLSPAVAGLTAADVWGYSTRDLTAAAITSATFASGAITATGIATDAIGSDEIAASALTEIKTSVQTGLFYLKTATATTGNRIHFIPFASNGSPTKSATGVTCQISLDGSAPATIADTPTEVEFTRGAYWMFDLSLAETSGKAAVIMCIGTGMVDTPLMVEFQN